MPGVSKKKVDEAARLLYEAGERGLSKEALAQSLEVSEKTVDRIRGQLHRNGFSISIHPDGRSRPAMFVLDRKALPASKGWLTTDLMEALHLASETLRGSNAEAWADRLDTFIEKAQKALPTWESNEVDLTEHRFLVNTPTTVAHTASPSVLGSVLEAMRSQGPFQITFKMVNGTNHSGCYFPHKIIFDALCRGSFLLAWDTMKGEPAFIRLSRILSLNSSIAWGSRPDLGMLKRAESYQIGGLFRPDPIFLVKFRIRGAHWIQGMRDAPPNLPQFKPKLPLDRSREEAEFSFQATELLGPCRWLLQFGPDLEVLEPTQLRDLVRQRLRAAADLYGEP